MSLKQKGLDRLHDILGENGKTVVERLTKISPDFAEYIVNFVYADLYARPGLSDKERELIVVTSLISQGNTGIPLKTHIHGMLNVGWTQAQIIELIIFITCYTGFPAAVDALVTAQEVFDTL